MRNNLSTENISMGIIVFDLDGTLVNSMPTQAKVFSDILQIAFSIPEKESQREYLITAGQPLDKQFEHTTLLYGHKVEKTHINELVQKFWKYLEFRKFELFPFTLQAISEFKKAGYVLSISSGSSPSVVVAKLQYTKIYEYFSIVLGSDYESGTLIKGIEHFEQIRNILGVSKSFLRQNTLLVGDGTHDAEIAKSADIKFVGIANNKNEKELISAGANCIINNLSELINILTNIDGHAFIPVSQLNFRSSQNPQS